MNKEFKYGRIAMIVGLMMAISPYLLHLALIAYVFGLILILLSKKELGIKTIWILTPIIFIGGLYWYYITR